MAVKKKAAAPVAAKKTKKVRVRKVRIEKQKVLHGKTRQDNVIYRAGQTLERKIIERTIKIEEVED